MQEHLDIITKLQFQLDEAHREICELITDESKMKDPPFHHPVDYAEFRGWNCYPQKIIYFCDNCGRGLEESQVFFYNEVPWDVSSANQGESAVVCRSCVGTLSGFEE